MKVIFFPLPQEKDLSGREQEAADPKSGHGLNLYEKNKDSILILLQNIRQNPRFYSPRAYSLIRDFGKLTAQFLRPPRAYSREAAGINPGGRWSP